MEIAKIIIFKEGERRRIPAIYKILVYINTNLKIKYEGFPIYVINLSKYDAKETMYRNYFW